MINKTRAYLGGILVIVGISFAFISPSSSVCGPYSLLIKEGCELFVAEGNIASDQNLGHYKSLGSVSYDCLNSRYTCIYYLDPLDNKIKQCSRGSISY